MRAPPGSPWGSHAKPYLGGSGRFVRGGTGRVARDIPRAFYPIRTGGDPTLSPKPRRGRGGESSTEPGEPDVRKAIPKSTAMVCTGMAPSFGGRGEVGGCLGLVGQGARWGCAVGGCCVVLCLWGGGHAGLLLGARRGVSRRGGVGSGPVGSCEKLRRAVKCQFQAQHPSSSHRMCDSSFRLG